MVTILTSSPGLELHGGLNPANNFIENLRPLVKDGGNVAYVASEPDMPDLTDEYAATLLDDFRCSGFDFARFTVVDGRNAENAAEIIAGSDFTVLAGGHVPTQNRFFRKIGLKEILNTFNGTVMGISAGTMNSASTVYCAPELEGEALDSRFERFISGLALTDIMVFPHFNLICGEKLDGFHIIRDIVLPDSKKRKIYGLPDGSYFINDRLYGPAYLFSDGTITAL